MFDIAMFLPSHRLHCSKILGLMTCSCELQCGPIFSRYPVSSMIRLYTFDIKDGVVPDLLQQSYYQIGRFHLILFVFIWCIYVTEKALGLRFLQHFVICCRLQMIPDINAWTSGISRAKLFDNDYTPSVQPGATTHEWREKNNVGLLYSWRR